MKKKTNRKQTIKKIKYNNTKLKKIKFLSFYFYCLTAGKTIQTFFHDAEIDVNVRVPSSSAITSLVVAA